MPTGLYTYLDGKGEHEKASQEAQDEVPRPDDCHYDLNFRSRRQFL